MELLELNRLLAENTYPGRGIVAGLTPDGKEAAIAYFIMGRSQNSRNRIFAETEDGIRTQAFDPRKMEDPSLIIYHPVRTMGKAITIVTNGDQTDTIRDGLRLGSTFERALQTRTFEPDGPNWTPRISAMVVHTQGVMGLTMSILKSADGNGDYCQRYVFDYPGLPAGEGRFLHTYKCDGDPIPSFEGEPERVAIRGDLDSFAAGLWENLNPQNKVSLFVRFIHLATGEHRTKIINANV